MNKKIKYPLSVFLLFGFVGLFAQGTSNLTNATIGKKAPQYMLDSVEFNIWDTIYNKYKLIGTKRFYYDEDGNNHRQVVSEYVEQYNLNYPYLITDLIYYSKNKPEVEYCFARLWSEWDFYKKTETGYGNIDEKIYSNYYDWISSNWRLTNSKSYKYNNNKKLVYEIDTFFTHPLGNISNIAHSYYENGMIASDVMSNWKYASWENCYKNEYLYNTNLQLDSVTGSKWDEVYHTWELDTMIANSYFSKGSLSSTVHYIWNKNNGKMETKNIELFEVNEAMNIEDIAMPTDNLITKGFNHQILSKSEQEFRNNDFRNHTIQQFYYSPFKAITNVNETTETNIHIYPNPTAGLVFIDSKQVIELINIVDITGNLVHHQTNNSPIDLSQHAKGIYFINITTEKGVANKKIMLNN